MFSTIRARLVWLVLFALLPASAIIVYDEIQLRRRIFREIHREAAKVGSLVQERTESLIEETHAQLRTLARMPEIRAMNTSAGARLAEVLGDQPIYTSLAITDPSGKVVGSALPFQGEARFDRFDSFKKTIATKSFSLGKYNFNPISGKPGFNLGYPLLEPDGRLTGVLIVSLGFSWVADFIAQADLPKKRQWLFSIPMALSFTGRWNRPNGSEEHGQGAAGADNPQTGRAGNAVLKGFDGVERLYAYAPIRSGTAEMSAYVAVGISTSVAEAEARRSLLRNLLILIIGGLISVGIASFVSEKLFLHDTRVILKTARRLEAGDLAVRTGLPSGSAN